MAPRTDRTVILVNPEAGGGQATKIARAARDYLAQVGYAADFEEASSAEELREKARQAAEAGCRRVVALGGDGTVHQVINAVRHTSLMGEAPHRTAQGEEMGGAIGIIPCGSGDDFASNLGLPRDPLAACNVLLNGRVRRVDVAEVGAEVYACIGGIGLDSMANRRANLAPAWLRGQFRYVLATLRTLAGFQPMDFELRADGKVLAGKMTSVIVANARSFGSGLRVAPRARLDDGLLDVCLFREMSWARMLEVLPRAIHGEHLSEPEVEYFQAREIEIRTDPPGDYYADGDFMARSPVKIRVLEKALPMLVPMGGASR
ncbi:MAG TPA: diacylglycerol kinase family protein [Candidatus Acidoferrales bacterium]